MSSLTAVHQYREKALAAASKLFEIGVLADAPDDESFILRLNTLVARRRTDADKNAPVDLSDAIKADGALKAQAELIVLGRWLLLEGHPGMKRQGGPQPDPRRILKGVAAILAELHTRPLKTKHDVALDGRSSRKRGITKHGLAKQWDVLFGDKITPSMFDSLLRSLQRILPLYLKHLKSGAANHAGKQIKKSPEIKRVLDAISGILPKSKKNRPDILTEPDVKHAVRLVPFEIALSYQSSAHEEEYRKLPKGTRPIARLRYVPKITSATSTSGTIRADRDGKIVLIPEVDIRRDYRAHALIDRIAITVETRDVIIRKDLQAQIKKHTGIALQIHDLRKPEKQKTAWGVPLVHLDEWKRRGAPFAIMIQDPTPNLLSAILKAITDGPGIEGPVLLHLIEVSADFYPKNASTPEEIVLLRERMVGLLQRHHWARPSLFVDPDSPKPRDTDARQIYDEETEYGEIVKKYRYLFPHEKSSGIKYKVETDALISDPAIRDRILTTRPGYDLFLHSTLMKGGKYEPCHVSVQHKIADRRNPAQNTFLDLADQDRRARVEVTISGTETLKKRGLETIDDLGSISFRNLTKDLLSFKLGIIEPWQHLLEDAKTQMRTRGVYGIDLRMRALELERRNAMKQAGEKLPRKREKEGMALQDWPEMNNVIGKAFDELKRRWSGFTTK